MEMQKITRTGSLSQITQDKVKCACDITDKDWNQLKELFVLSFVTTCQNVSKQDLELMNNDPATFWANVFDRDKPQVVSEKYEAIMFKSGDTVIAYILYVYLEDSKYLYVRHLCVSPNYQGQSLGKKLIAAMSAFHLGSQQIGLLTRTYNQRAQDFYIHLGFRISQNPPAYVLKFYKPDRVYLEKH